jgi:hypothetical protein
MILKALQYNLPIQDREFDMIYPKHIQQLSNQHWTSIDVAKKASFFLVNKPNVKVLDIGSGVGKFCIVGALTTSGDFYGVEQRKELADISKKIVSEYRIANLKILHSNITDINFSDYNSFYFFNSFYENLDKTRIIDLNVKISPHRYQEYRDYMYSQLSNAPIGTRLATYYSLYSEIPPGYKIVETYFNDHLVFWIKDKTLDW